MSGQGLEQIPESGEAATSHTFTPPFSKHHNHLGHAGGVACPITFSSWESLLFPSSFIHLSSKYLMSTTYVSGTVLGARET